LADGSSLTKPVFDKDEKTCIAKARDVANAALKEQKENLPEGS
jgi:hypothetical protein